MEGPATTFDQVARGYDASFSDRAPAQWLRAAVRERLTPLIAPGDATLDAGCGTGLDAVWLAQRGCRVVAADVSAEMLSVCRERVSAAGVLDQVRICRLDLREPEAGEAKIPSELDLVVSNFGALNCVDDLRPFLEFARRHLTMGGYLATVLMGRFCLWETLFFVAKRRPKAAIRRWKGRATYVVSGAECGVWYWSPTTVLAAAEGFAKHSLAGVGGLIPSSEAFGLCERFPRVFSAAARLDRRLAPFTAAISDHYLLILRKVA